jgi:hypothetical protein
MRPAPFTLLSPSPIPFFAPSAPSHRLIKQRTFTMTFKQIASLIVLFSLAVLTGCAAGPSESFDSPQQAADTLVSALRAHDEPQLKKILGSNYQDLVYSGDDVADKNAIKHFVTGYDQKHSLILSCDDEKCDSSDACAQCADTAVIAVGEDQWPMAIPILKDAKTGKWAFDPEAGHDELLSRRIGRNELETIQVCLAIVDAQKEYAARDPMKSGKPNYATRIASTPGKNDGLYWPTKPGQQPSPLGALVAKASAGGYDPASGPSPFNGYRFRVLTSQTIPGHPGRATVNFTHPGNFVLGFAVVAYPAKYGNSGVMSFIVNQRGIVYEKDLGPDTENIASQMTTYDPANGWQKAQVENK